MVMDTKTVLNVKTDRKLKKEAQKVARAIGLPLGAVINAYLRDFVREKRVIFSVPATPNATTKRILEAALRNAKQGKNISGDFSYKEAISHLDAL